MRNVWREGEQQNLNRKFHQGKVLHFSARSHGNSVNGSEMKQMKKKYIYISNLNTIKKELCIQSSCFAAPRWMALANSINWLTTFNFNLDAMNATHRVRARASLHTKVGGEWDPANLRNMKKIEFSLWQGVKLSRECFYKKKVFMLSFILHRFFPRDEGRAGLNRKTFFRVSLLISVINLWNLISRTKHIARFTVLLCWVTRVPCSVDILCFSVSPHGNDNRICDFFFQFNSNQETAAPVESSSPPHSTTSSQIFGEFCDVCSAV